MSRPRILLVAPPAVKRPCQFCGGELAVIEIWHGCPERRLARALYQLRTLSHGRREANA